MRDCRNPVRQDLLHRQVAFYKYKYDISLVFFFLTLLQVLCTDETIDILNTSVSKPFVVTLASALNALAVLIFIFGIYWVSYQQVCFSVRYQVMSYELFFTREWKKFIWTEILAARRTLL